VSRRPIRFGVCLPQHGSSWEEVVRVARACDRLGFDSVWAVDHFFGIPDTSVPLFEGWTEIAALAGVTSRVRLGHLVLCVSYRLPSVLAKMAATLDHATNGRFILGLGAGWHQYEYQAYGIPFPHVATRLEQLDEALAIIRKMWTEEPATFAGKHFQVTEAHCRPRPLQTPHPPILIGGAGERVLLRLVARHANIWNNLGVAHRQMPHKLDVLRRHCDAVGRDPNEIEVTAMYRDLAPGADVSEVVRGAEALARIGVATVVTGALGDDPAGWLESTFGPAMEQLKAIEVAPL